MDDFVWHFLPKELSSYDILKNKEEVLISALCDLNVSDRSCILEIQNLQAKVYELHGRRIEIQKKRNKIFDMMRKIAVEKSAVSCFMPFPPFILDLCCSENAYCRRVVGLCSSPSVSGPKCKKFYEDCALDPSLLVGAYREMRKFKEENAFHLK